jgi:NADPH-dependent 2,4-dienoyl-CoA reductase/sulfur reductase-like enzyme
METYKTSVLVVGGGPSGLAAAVSCSRLGIKTTLIERFGIVGGNLTLGHVAPIMGDVSHGTIVDEVINLLNLKWDVAHDIEKTKIALSNWLANEKVDLFLQTVAIGTIMEGNTIKGVIANNPSW